MRRPLEVFALNEQMFRATGSIPYRSLRWVRRYTEPGEFEMVVPSDVYDPSWSYIYTPFRPETGIIQKVQFDDSAESYAGIDSVTLSGFFLESVLNRATFLEEKPDVKQVEHTITIAPPSNPYYKTHHVPTLYQDPVGDYYVSDGSGGIVSVEDGRTIDSDEGLSVVYDGHDFPAGSVGASYNYYLGDDKSTVHVIDPYDRGTVTDGEEYNVVVRVPDTGTVFYRDRFGQVKPALGCVERMGQTYAMKKMVYDEFNGKTWTETVTLQGPWQLTDMMEPVTAGDSVEIVMRWVRRMMGDWMNYAVTDVTGVHKTVDPSFQLLGDLAYSTLYEVGASFRVEYNFLNDGFLFSVYRGRDLTQEGNDPEENVAEAPRLLVLSDGGSYPVPEGYMALEYVESHATTASDGQYVDTAYKVTQQTSIEVDFQYTNLSNHTWMALLGSRGAGPSYESRVCFMYTNGKWREDWVNTQNEVAVGSDELARHVLHMKGGTATLDDGTTITISRTMTSNELDLYLFAINTGGTHSTCCNARIYSARITEGDAPQRDFVPARRESDGAVGLYDTVGGSFYQAEGTGALIAGPEIERPPAAATLTYMPNAADVTGSMQVVSGVVGDTVEVALCQFLRDGYSFTQWSTQDDGGGNSYQPGESYVLTGNDVLYATWSKNPGPDPGPEPSFGGNPWCVFSDTWGTIHGYSASRDTSNYRNACYVLYDYNEPDGFDSDGQPEVKVETHVNTEGPTIMDFYIDSAKVYIPYHAVQGVVKARIEDGQPEAQTYLDLRDEKPSCDEYWSTEVKELSFEKETTDEDREAQIAEAKEGLVKAYEDGTKPNMKEIYDAFYESLRPRGTQKLKEDYCVVTNLDTGTVETDGYRREWDLGDLVDFGVSTIGLMETGRVIEVEETYEGGSSPRSNVSITVGDKRLTDTKRATLN